MKRQKHGPEYAAGLTSGDMEKSEFLSIAFLMFILFNIFYSIIMTGIWLFLYSQMSSANDWTVCVAANHYHEYYIELYMYIAILVFEIAFLLYFAKNFL